ncbi:glycosyltransferase [Sphingomonas morindae]|uniref:Mannosyltransferase n=1 Tax=Sphingomonas morindae TaxID=1541170 RepID=A0ABY4XCP4_9SPHN|nr:glycosyltransferase [Sphingomonas morindae]USI74740.1 mannosyltransferase [Sphingomonas morindae]
MIPKILHFIWVGDESKRPDNCIQTWVRQHRDWDIRLWGNEELAGDPWVNRAHMAAMAPRELNGVADMMRWEILHAHGGIVLDADSICLRPLDPALLDCPAFACWESEIARPGLIAAGYFGCEPGNPFVAQIIEDIAAAPSVVHDMAWKTVGPQRLTDAYRTHRYTPLRIYPSHYFIPEHFTGIAYEGSDPVYAHQLWGSTRRAYDVIHQHDLGAVAPVSAPAEAAPVATSPDAAPAETVAEAVAAPAPAPRASPLEAAHAPYFVQRVEVDDSLARVNRVEVFRQICAGKRVLHIGCADWPITDPATSLHLALEPHCALLDGFDVHEEALAQLAPLTKGRLFSRIEQIADRYDVVLVPEVMEHVPDVPTFLGQLEAIDAELFFLTVPDAFQCGNRHFDYLSDSKTFVEVVHPDHNVWYTPYTFANSVRKYSGFNVEKLWFFNGISLLALLSKPRLALAA